VIESRNTDLHDATRLTRLLSFALATLTGLLSFGCRSTDTSTVATDAKIVRHAESASQAFAEGDTDEASESFRRAIRRAWAIDDPSEAGTNSYNLAACLASQSRPDEAMDWLIESRAELRRAGKSTGNTYLLEAKILQAEGDFAGAADAIDRAVCADPPCGEHDQQGCRFCGDDPCRESCLSRIPCVGTRIEDRAAIRDCEDFYAAQIELARSRLAAERYDIACAIEHFSTACRLAEDVCSDDLAAELQDVAALIHLAKGEYFQAAAHFDREADHLRRAGNYREIPDVLELSAAAYVEVERFDLAAGRLLRVARIWYGRGELKKSWEILQDALRYADMSPWSLAGELTTTQVRSALLAHEIELTLTDRGDDLNALSPPQPML